MILPIYTYGDIELRKISNNIDLNNNNEIKEINNLISDMLETLNASGGVGLAAPQVGKSYNLFIIKNSNDDFFSNDTVFINSKILNKSVEKNYMNESCLSIPTINEPISRYNWIEIEYYDLNFNKQIKQFHGLQARIIQHEYDHICGVLLISRLSIDKRKNNNKLLIKIKNKRIKTEYLIYKKKKYVSKKISNIKN